MNENRNGFIISALISIISIGLVILSQYDNITVKTVFCMGFPFIIGHRSLWENIFMGIFSGAILTVASTAIGYFVDRNRNDYKIKNLFYDLNIEILRFEARPESRKDVFIEKVSELWQMSCEYDSEDRPFYILRKRHIINKEIHCIIRDINLKNIEYEDTSDNNARELLKKVKEIKTDYNKIDSYFEKSDEKYNKNKR